MTPNRHAGWRWTLIVSEVVVASYLVALQLADRRTRLDTGVALGLGVLAFVAWLFLFFGSPFLVRTHRWLAILGWGIAVAVIIFSKL